MMANISRYNERWPKGHPLGGRFKPRDALAAPWQREVLRFQGRARATLSHPFAQHLAAQMGVRPETLRQVNARLIEHASRLLAVVGQSRPQVARKMAKVNLSWGDFGDAPLAAWYEPQSQTIILNPRHAFGPHGTMDGLLRTLTHEFAHLLDESVGEPGKSAFAGAFEPLHRFIERRAKKRGLEGWLYWTRLAYPATGFYSLAGGLTASLPEEYISVLSELHWHHPEDLARLQRLLDEGGYDGPPLRQLIGMIWGGSPAPPPTNLEIPETWLERFDGRALGMRHPGRVVPWKAPQSDWKRHLLPPPA